MPMLIDTGSTPKVAGHLRQRGRDDRAVQDLHEEGDGDDEGDGAGLPAETFFGGLLCGLDGGQ